MNAKQTTELLKRATARIKALESELNSRKKIASLKGKRAEIAAEVATEVKDKLLEAGVPEEAAQTATEIVETAVTEAELTKEENAEPQPEGEVIDDETKSELAEMAASDELSEEAKLAALTLIKNKCNKSAFGKTIVNLLKKTSSGNMTFGGSVRKESGSGNGKVSQNVMELREYADKQSR